MRTITDIKRGTSPYILIVNTGIIKFKGHSPNILFSTDFRFQGAAPSFYFYLLSYED